MLVSPVLNRWTAGYDSASQVDQRRARRLAGAVILSVVAYSVSIVVAFMTGQALIAIPIFLTIIALMACGVALTANLAIDGIANAFIAVNAVLLFGMLLATGGASVGFLIGMPVVPAFAMLVGNRRAIIFWSAMTIAAIAAALVLNWLDVTFPIRPDPDAVAIGKFYAAIVVIGVILGVADLIWKDWANILQALRLSRDREKEASKKLRIAAQTAKLGYWSFPEHWAKGLYLPRPCLRISQRRPPSPTMETQTRGKARTPKINPGSSTSGKSMHECETGSRPIRISTACPMA